MSVEILLVTRDGVEMPGFASQNGSVVTIEDNDGNVALEVNNPTGGPLNLVVARTALLPDGDVAGPKTISIPAGATRWCGPWPPAVFNDTANRVSLTPDAGLGLRGLRW